MEKSKVKTYHCSGPHSNVYRDHPQIRSSLQPLKESEATCRSMYQDKEVSEGRFFETDVPELNSKWN
jgi:hypothetical protein